jgi:hypothetical protein
MQPGDEIADFQTLLGDPHPDRTTVMRRAFLFQIAVFDHLFDVIGNIGAEIISTVRQFADSQLFLADIGQDERLDIVDIGDTRTVQFYLDDFKELPVQTFDPCLSG